jgi:hypothetical protein
MEQPVGLFAPLAGASCFCPACLAKRIGERALQAS